MQNLVQPNDKNIKINMVPGGLGPFQNNENNNLNSNFSKYYEGEKENNSDIIPHQFKDNNNEDNPKNIINASNVINTNMINNNNNGINNNIIKSNVIYINNDGIKNNIIEINLKIII